MHEIFGERFLSNREPAWHGLGLVMERRVTAVEALRLMGEYSIRTEQLVTQSGGLEAPRKAIIREATKNGEAEVVLGTVGPEFNPIGPLATCSIWDEAVDVPVETIGALRNGAPLFISTKLPRFSVKGDEMQDYLLVSNPMDGGESAEILRTPVRVVCANTLRLGKQQGTETFRIVHDENAQKRMFDWLHGLYQKAVKQAALIKEACEVLATYKVKDAEAIEILDEVYPEPKNLRGTAPSEIMRKSEKHRVYASEHMTTNREQALKLFKGDGRGAQTVAASGTAWGLYNSVIEYEDYRWARNPRQALESSVFGARADVKDKAFDVCAERAGVRSVFAGN